MTEQRPVDFPRFMGEPTTCEGADRVRLSRQLQQVYDLMNDGQPRTLRQIADAVGCSEASASARLRDLRQVRIMGAGVRQVSRAKIGIGLYTYKVHPWRPPET